tara:strand:- start:1587 stop:1991 length:405 start_codon:yes stop_codon:yes gene_type:complete
MIDRLFAYGTLRAPELLHSVIGRRIEGTPAVLEGYICRRVRHTDYPAICQRTGSSTQGSVYCGIDAPAWWRLDAFESNLYERSVVEISQAGSANSMAYTYVIADAYKKRLTDEAWVLEHFRHSHLNRYLSQFHS